MTIQNELKRFSHFDYVSAIDITDTIHIKNTIMQKASLINDLVYSDGKPTIQKILETPFSKEIRILFKKDQIMKEHTAPGAIVVEIFEGAIDFGVKGEINKLVKGDLVTLDAKVPHDLKATEDSIVRLTLSKSDTVERVFSVLK